MPGEIKAIHDQFAETLKNYDKARNDGQSLWKVWEECTKFHRDNEMVRANMNQMEVVFQSQLTQWTKDRLELSKAVARLNPGGEDYIEKREQLMNMNETAVRTCTLLAESIRGLKKEIRQTEFQSRFFYHVNLVQQFITGVTAILFKHLASEEKRKHIEADIRSLAKIFMMQEATTVKD